MLPKPWHFLFPFNSERFIKLSAVPRQCTPLYLPVADLLARPALPFVPQRGRGRGRGRAPRALQPVPGSGLLSSPASPEAAAAAARAARCVFTDRGPLQRDPRVSSVVHARTGSSPRGISREGHRPRTLSAAELQNESKLGGPALPAEGTLPSAPRPQPRHPALADGQRQGGPGEPLTYGSRLLLPGQSRDGSRGTFTETLDPQRGRSAGPGPGGGRHVAEC